MVNAPLTPHDLRILQLAAQDPEGCLTFYITQDGSIALLGTGAFEPLPAEDSFPRLEELGYLRREVSCTFVLTPSGWDAVQAWATGTEG
jgi:hypothetical protein